ncbi:glutathione S-transferase family protein [Mangrovimicrobium sediminis]|uniref:Glutathione S-transferase family protein n=2 Tax=Mangrovimicrobium sediminis TaxID=2562682 RepID=A0A4Z0M2Z4_9GAMM|nr:glutathione S-transferase family protein [Haliea sp. SAOS-164]
MKFYFTPGACSIGIHILLEELELVFEAYLVNLVKGEHLAPEYLAINPHGTIPSLVAADGEVLTDFIAIANWLAEKYPRRKLLPDDPQRREAVLDTLAYCVNTIHGQGYTRVFTTGKYSDNPAQHAAIQEAGWSMVRAGLEELDRRYAAGELYLDTFSVADAAQFYVEFWAQRSEVALPPFCERHYRQMLQRPAVRQVLMEEGYYSVLN